MGFLPYVLLVMVPGILLSLWAAYRVRTTYAKWDRVDSGITMSAFDFARYLLNAQGLNEVTVEPTPGNLTDHYDPRTRTLRISTGVAGTAQRGQPFPMGRGGGFPSSGYPSTGYPAGRYAPAGLSATGGDPNGTGAADGGRGRLSVSQVAVIAHEVGHALQHKTHDPMMALRQTVVPVAQIGSTLAPWLVIAGVFMHIFGLAVVGLIFFAGAVAFTFVTLPVEFGASNRALAFVAPLGMTGDRGAGARDVLRAAGWTYVAAALTALLTFAYYLMLVFGSRR